MSRRLGGQVYVRGVSRIGTQQHGVKSGTLRKFLVVGDDVRYERQL